MGPTAATIVARLIDWIEKRPSDGLGCPPSATVRVVEALHYFLREGPQWREMRATEDRVSGSTLRHCLMDWSGTALLRWVHAALIPNGALWTGSRRCSLECRRGQL